MAEMRLEDKLRRLQVDALDLSEYNLRYLQRKLPSLPGILEVYGRLLFLSLCDREIAMEQCVLVDYGGGTGLISLLAAETGVGTVIYDDIYEVSCQDFSRLARALGLSLSHVVCGDVDELIRYVNSKSLRVDAVMSYDVLEHIYDVEVHFARLATLAHGEFRIVHASGANSANPRYVREVRRKQQEVELRDRERKAGHKERDSLCAYLDLRRRMIASYAPDLSPEIVEHLAKATRGLVQSDIEKCVEEFRQRGSIAYRMTHPTNTCDPRTGNWCEHLLEFPWLDDVLGRLGYQAGILPGRYDTRGRSPITMAKRLLNAGIIVLGRSGMFLAPYYVVVAMPSDSNGGPSGVTRNVLNLRTG